MNLNEALNLLKDEGYKFTDKRKDILEFLRKKMGTGPQVIFGKS